MARRRRRRSGPPAQPAQVEGFQKVSNLKYFTLEHNGVKVLLKLHDYLLPLRERFMCIAVLCKLGLHTLFEVDGDPAQVRNKGIGK